MKKVLNFTEMESISGGNTVDNFCAGFGAVSAVYAVGVAVNWWNPIGWGGTIAGIVVGAGCGLYAIR
jgi:hypothetical protein